MRGKQQQGRAKDLVILMSNDEIAARGRLTARRPRRARSGGEARLGAEAGCGTAARTSENEAIAR